MNNSPTSQYTLNQEPGEEMPYEDLEDCFRGLQLSHAIEFLKDWAPAGPWDLVSIQAGSPRGRRFMPGQEADLFDWLATENADRSVYFHLNPCRSAPASGKATKGDIEVVVALHVDADPRVGHDLQAERQRILQTFRNPPKGVPVPSCCVDSGGGFQAYWVLREPVEVNGNVEEIERHTRWLEQQFGADNCHNIDRLMRLPGTVNWPNPTKRARGRTEAHTGVMWWEQDRVYDLSEFGEAEPKARASEGVADFPSDHPPIENLDGLRAKRVPEQVLKLIEHGHEPNADRSRDVLHVAGGLIRSGVAPEAVYSILTDEAWPISESIQQKGDREAIRAIQKAVAAVEEERRKRETASNRFRDALRQQDRPIEAAPTDSSRLRSVNSSILDLKSPPALVKGLIYEGDLVMPYGAPGSGKTFVVLDLALAIAAGSPTWAGHKVVAGSVVYVAGEGKRGLYNRIHAWAKRRGDARGQLDRLDGRLFVFEGAPQFLDDADWAAFLADLGAIESPRLIVFDTLSRCIAGKDENNQGDMSAAVDRLRNLSLDTRAAIMLVHHSAKDGQRERGSSVLRGAADVMFRVSKDADAVTLEFDKIKEGELPDDALRFRFEGCQLGVDDEGDAIRSATVRFEPPRKDGIGSTELKLLKALADMVGEDATAKEWAKAAGLATRGGRFNERVRALVKAALVSEDPTRGAAPRFAVTWAGKSLLGIK